jgi:N-acetyl-alpha-D-glucosaminyl L-malate synthase BshA
MNIAILVPLFLPKWQGGTEIATHNIALRLVARGHEVHVITSLDKGMPKMSVNDGFYIHRVLWPNIKNIGIILYWLKIIWILKRIKPDIIHSQQIIMGIPAFLTKIPYVVWGQGSDVYLPWKSKQILTWLSFSHANALIALTEDMKKEMRKIYKRDIYIIPNGINLQKFSNVQREHVRDKLGIQEKEKIIIFVGSLYPIKGIKYLIQAIHIVKEKEENARLIIVGDGHDKAELENIVQELKLKPYVTFVGRVPNDKVPEYLAVSDIFVLPSLSEGFPIVNIEAMASGLPIIATNVGGIQEIVINGENGFLVESKNSDQIAQRIMLLLSDDKMRQWISRNNKNKATSYSWDIIVGKLEQLYNNTIYKSQSLH